MFSELVENIILEPLAGLLLIVVVVFAMAFIIGMTVHVIKHWGEDGE